MFVFLILILGAIFSLGGRLPIVGRLPGDLVIQRGRWTIFVPLGTSLVISLLLGLVLRVLRS